MTDTQPTPPPANCSLCRFAREVRPDPTAIQAQLVCMLMPPSPCPIHTQKGVQILTMFPAVNAGMSCFQFQPAQLTESEHVQPV